jgi:hypothetical protein
MAAFVKDAELDVVFGYVEQFYSPELDDIIKGKIKCPSEPIAVYHAGIMLIKRDSLLKVGKFESNWKVADFIDWYIKASLDRRRMQG